jgi:hypothetical protein
MVEATPSLTQAQRQAERQVIAVRVLCERRACEEIKDQIRRQGKVKLSRVPARDITAMARARLVEDAEYRARLIEEARPIVDQWTAEGFFGKRAAQRQLERNSTVLHNERRPDLRGLRLFKCHAQNGKINDLRLCAGFNRWSDA